MLVPILVAAPQLPKENQVLSLPLVEPLVVDPDLRKHLEFELLVEPLEEGQPMLVRLLNWLGLPN